MLTAESSPRSPNWLALDSPDTDAAAEFYGEIFGWAFQSAGPDAVG